MWIFSIAKFETATGGEMMSDGKRDGTTLKKPKLIRTDPLPPKKEDYSAIIGRDPGRRSFYSRRS